MAETEDNSSDLFSSTSVDKLSTKRRISILLLCCLIAGATVYWTVPIRDGVKDIFGRPMTKGELRRNIFSAILVYYPLFALIVGAFISLIPFKRRKYGDKYLPFSLYSLLTIYLLLTVLRLGSFVLTLNK